MFRWVFAALNPSYGLWFIPVLKHQYGYSGMSSAVIPAVFKPESRNSQ